MATPSVAWKNVHHRAKRFQIGCWSKSRIGFIWEAAGSPERITAPIVARIGLRRILRHQSRLPIRYLIRWCVGLMSVEQAKSLFKKLRLPPPLSDSWARSAQSKQIWIGRNVHAVLADYVCTWGGRGSYRVYERRMQRRSKKVLTLISKFK